MIKPHSYQVPIISSVVSALRRDGRTLMVMATGTGKTITSALVVQKLVRKRGRMLFLCHNNDILRQAMDSYRAVFNGSHTMGMFTGEEKADPKKTEFLFASFQTMHGHRDIFEANAFDIVVVDESHHTQAETFRPTVEYFDPAYLLGMTATPDRADGRDICDLFGKPSVTLTLEEAIARNFLAHVTYKLMTVGTASREALRRLKKRVKDGARITLRELDDNVFIENLDEDVADAIMSHKGQGIIFCTSIEQAEGMAMRLKKAKPYHSGMSREDCRHELKAFREKQLRYLLTVDKFNEGIDIPHAEVVAFLRSTESMTIFLQQLGRGLRKTKDKERVTVLDFVGNADRVKMVSDFVRRVGDFDGSDREEFDFDASGIDFDLDEEARDVLDILKRINVEFYPTMAEAMAAVARLGIRSQKEYWQRYREDPRLPHMAHITYSKEWRGWTYFLTGSPIRFYPTMAEASAAAIKLGIKNEREYRRRYKEDSRLPSSPNATYAKEWKGWIHFLYRSNSRFYPTLAEAMLAVAKLGIRTQEEYWTRYREDPKLPSNPVKVYSSEWVDWRHFLTGKERRSFYPTMAQAMKAVQKLGIQTHREYNKLYRKDPMLPAHPYKLYASEWKGWPHFLGKTKKGK